MYYSLYVGHIYLCLIGTEYVILLQQTVTVSKSLFNMDRSA